MTRLSVNINKIATLRNARGGNNPNVLQVALDLEMYGAQGITVHPRPDERHIKYKDVLDLRPAIRTEFNIEGFPDERLIDMVLKVLPTQVTLVPDSPDQITSNAGWNTKENQNFLVPIIDVFKKAGIRTSVFVNADEEMVLYAAKAGADRVELYTEPYASGYKRKEEAVKPFIGADNHIRLSAWSYFRTGNWFFFRFVTRLPVWKRNWIICIYFYDNWFRCRFL